MFSQTCRFTDRLVCISVEHLDLHHADGLPSLLYRASYLGQERYGRRLGFGEDVDVVRSHALLGNEDFL